jgi:hypothetical protein
MKILHFVYEVLSSGAHEIYNYQNLFKESLVWPILKYFTYVIGYIKHYKTKFSVYNISFGRRFDASETIDFAVEFSMKYKLIYDIFNGL